LGRLQHRTVPGFTYFITTKTWESRPIFQVPENAAILLQCILRYRSTGAYLLHEFVIMPKESIRDSGDYQLKAGYIRNNPVHAGLVDKPEEWPYGSAADKAAMDAPPERLTICSSGAKAPQIPARGMSELKLRPPKVLS